MFQLQAFLVNAYLKLHAAHRTMTAEVEQLLFRQWLGGQGCTVCSLPHYWSSGEGEHTGTQAHCIAGIVHSAQQ